MLPSLAELITTNSAPISAELQFRSCASLESSGHLPSILELIPELSDKSSKVFDARFRRESEPRCRSLKNYKIINTCTALNTSPFAHQKRRRLSVDYEEDAKRHCEETDPRARESHRQSGHWGNYCQQHSALTPDPSPTSRRSSTFSSNGTWTGSPPNNHYAKISPLSPFERAERQSRSENQAAPDVSSSPRYLSQTDLADSNIDNKPRPDDRCFHNLPVLNLSDRIHASSNASMAENEYSLESSAPQLHPSQSILELSGFSHGSDNKIKNFRGHFQSDSTSISATPRFLTQSPTQGPGYNPSVREMPFLQRSPVNELYNGSNCHCNINSNTGSRETKPRRRRGNLPKDTTEKLRTWFLNHLEHPYPTEDEKQQLMDSTGLQMNQISNWYINARRRHLPAITANARIETEARRQIQCSPIDTVSKKPEAKTDG